MKRELCLENLEVAKAAAKDAKKNGWNAELKQKDGKVSVFYESEGYCEEDKASEDKVAMKDVYSMIEGVYREMQYSMKWMREDYAYLQKQLYEHKKGHLPPIKDAGKMTAALKAIGMDDAVEVVKPSVYVEY